MKNLYDLLGVRPDDNAENIRIAYRKAAKANHPDHHGGDLVAAARFRQIAEAYDVLRDAEQRAAYDRLLEFERNPLRSKLKQALSGLMRHIISDAIVGVVLAIVLAGGYSLLAHVSGTSIEGAAEITAREPIETAALQPAGPAERDAVEHVTAPQMPIVTPVMADAGASDVAGGEPAPNSPGLTTGAAELDNGAEILVDQPSVKAVTGDPGKARTHEALERDKVHRSSSRK